MNYYTHYSSNDIFGFTFDIYDVLVKIYDHYSKADFLALLNRAKREHDFLLDENKKLKLELATINSNIVANLERDLLLMRKQIGAVIHPIHKYKTEKLVEELDV